MSEPKFSYTFGEDPEHSLEIREEKRDFRVFVDGREIGTIGSRDRQSGKSFYLEDKSSLNIRFTVGGLVVLFNGSPVSGSISPADAEGKGRVLKGASMFGVPILFSLLGISSELRLAAVISALIWAGLLALSFFRYSVAFFIAILVLLANFGTIIVYMLHNEFSMFLVIDSLIMPGVIIPFMIKGYIAYRRLRQKGMNKWYKPGLE